MTMPPGDWPTNPLEVDLGYQRGWDDAMAHKPPCACEGRLLLGKGQAEAYIPGSCYSGLATAEVRNGRVVLTQGGKGECWCGLKNGQPLEVLVFLPADELQEEA